MTYPLYVAAAFHAVKGLDCTMASLQENIEFWCARKRDDGYVAMWKEVHTMDDMRPKKIVLGAEHLDMIKQAIEQASLSFNTADAKAPVIYPSPFTKEEELEQEIQQRLAYEQALTDIYKTVEYAELKNFSVHIQAISSIKDIIEEVVDQYVLDGANNEKDS